MRVNWPQIDEVQTVSETNVMQNVKRGGDKLEGKEEGKGVSCKNRQQEGETWVEIKTVK